MQETPAKQYFFSRASTAYHPAETNTFSVCGLHFDGLHLNRRWNDWQLVNEKPRLPYMLCLKCRRKLTGEPEPIFNEDAATVDRTMRVPPP